jgi:hypothetical protein
MQLKRRLKQLAQLSLLSVFMSGTAWGGPGPKYLFYDLNAAPSVLDSEALDGALNVKTGRINFGLLRSGKLSLDTGQGLQLQLVRSRDITFGNGARIWEGSIEGIPDSTVVLGRQGKALSGSIRFDNRLLKVIPMAGGLHALAEFPPQQPAPEVLPISDGSGESGSAVPQGAAADGGTVIDVMVVYTPAARTALSSSGGIESLIALAVAESNVAYQNSQINMQLNLVHTEEVSYVAASGQSGWSTDLSRLKGSSDGYMDGIHATRDAVGADMVALIRAGDGAYCGIGYMNTSLASYWAFSVTYYSCATGYYSFAHELGHNKGSHHDPVAAGGSAALYDYSYGYQDPAGQFRTVMAYNCPGGCTRYQYFSNPNVTFQSTGKPTGVVDQTDNARSLNQAAPIAAAWRTGAATTVPASPSGGETEAVTEDQIGLLWADNSGDETGFSIEQSQDGASFSEIAVTGANATSYIATDLQADTDYGYRIYARNSIGPSTGYAQASATTGSPPPYVVRLVNSEQTTRASVSGTYLATQALDGVFQRLTETSSGGKKRDRYSLLEHRWSVDVAPGSAVRLFFTGSSDIGGGEEMVLSWSRNLQSWTTLLTLTGDHSNQNWTLPLLPTPQQGVVYFRLKDTQRVARLQSSNSVSVDYLAVQSDNAAAVELTTAPSLSGEIVDYTTASLWWDSLAGEAGYEIARSGGVEGLVDPAAILGPDATSYQDVGLAEDTPYTYQIRGFNAQGPSPDSNDVDLLTQTSPALPPPSTLPLTVEDSYKRRGVKHVVLFWGASSALIYVYRDGGMITESGISDTGYSETLGKGGGSYTYKICLADGVTCSANESVVF